MDVEQKPSRYFELESKHGKLDKLADVNLEMRKKVNVKIKYNGKYVHDKIDVRQTVGDFKKYLEKYVGLPSSRFKVRDSKRSARNNIPPSKPVNLYRFFTLTSKLFHYTVPRSSNTPTGVSTRSTSATTTSSKSTSSPRRPTP